MKLLMAIIHSRDQSRVREALLVNQCQFTQIASTGGFLREGNTTFLIGVEDERLEETLHLIKQNCRTREQYMNLLPAEPASIGTFYATPVKVQVGGAVVFVLSVERLERY